MTAYTQNTPSNDYLSTEDSFEQCSGYNIADNSYVNRSYSSSSVETK